jgi:hypothetical protein
MATACRKQARGAERSAILTVRRAERQGTGEIHTTRQEDREHDRVGEERQEAAAVPIGTAMLSTAVQATQAARVSGWTARLPGARTSWNSSIRPATKAA